MTALTLKASCLDFIPFLHRSALQLKEKERKKGHQKGLSYLQPHKGQLDN